jgi:hypothetical protein
MEAGAGIEPANRGFADLGLTTWLPRRRKDGKLTPRERLSIGDVRGKSGLGMSGFSGLSGLSESTVPNASRHPMDLVDSLDIGEPFTYLNPRNPLIPEPAHL